MSNLFVKLTNLLDQDFISFEEGMPIFDWLNKHREDINSIEKSYLDDFTQLKQQLSKKEKETEELKFHYNLLVEKYRFIEHSNICLDKKIEELRIQISQSPTQMAIQELNKVKIIVDGRKYLVDYIDGRIKELRGEL